MYAKSIVMKKITHRMHDPLQPDKDRICVIRKIKDSLNQRIIYRRTYVRMYDIG